jgi:hypothetical protein
VARGIGGIKNHGLATDDESWDRKHVWVWVLSEQKTFKIHRQTKKQEQACRGINLGAARTQHGDPSTANIKTSSSFRLRGKPEQGVNITSDMNVKIQLYQACGGAYGRGVDMSEGVYADA